MNKGVYYTEMVACEDKKNLQAINPGIIAVEFSPPSKVTTLPSPSTAMLIPSCIVG